MAGAAVVRAARCLALDALAAQAIVALRDRGIDSVLLKGPATVHWLYQDDPSRRRYTDVDLLVDPTRFDEAGAVLAEVGFRDRLAGLRQAEADRLYERAWVRAPGEMIEVHRGFFGVGDWAAFWAAMRHHSHRLAVAGLDVDVPDRVGGALVYALHAVAHGTERKLSRKPLADLDRALMIFDEETWREAAELAEAVGAAGAFAIGLSLQPAGAALVARLRLSRVAGPEVWVRAFGTQRRGDVLLARLIDAPSASARLSYLRDSLFPSAAVTLAGEPWARRNRLLLGAAYVYRWLRMAVLAPSAVANVMPLLRARPVADGRPPQPVSTLLRSTLRFVRHPSPRRLAAAWWTLRALRSTRTALPGTRPDRVRLPGLPPTLRARPDALLAQAGVVRRVLGLRGATCLESCIVRQRWLAAGARPVDLVVGVTGPSAEFRAHAWLDGDRGTGTFTELARYPARDVG